MVFQRTLLFLSLLLVTLTVAAGPAPAHEARQGPISVQPLSLGPGPVSLRTSSSTSTSTQMTTTTTSQVSGSEQFSAFSTGSRSQSPTSASPVSFSSSPAGSSPSPSPSGSPGTSSSTPQPSPTPGGIKFSINNMTTCTSAVISWNYTGEDAALFLSITNTGVNSTSSRIRTRQSTTNDTTQQQLVVTNTSAHSWTWPSVNVTQGWYELDGLVLTDPNVSNSSAPFYVSNGTSVACLTSTSPQASSTASPSIALSATSNKNVGKIVGGVVGGVIGIVLAVIAGICLWNRRRRFARGGGNTARKWGSLRSTQSSFQAEAPVTSHHSHTPSDSTGIIHISDGGGKASATSTPGDSNEDVATTGEEKLVSPVSSSGMTPFDVLNTPIHYDRRASWYTVQTPTSVITNESPLSRSGPRRTSNQSLEQQAQRIRSSMETSVRRRGERLSMPTLPPPNLSRHFHPPTSAISQEEYPLSPVAAMPVNRSISAGAVSVTARRASRKPVPQYDPSLLLEDANADSVSTFTGGAESSQSHGTGTAAGKHGTPPDLAHKTSFGDGRPVHYLIPDMPLLEQD